MCIGGIAALPALLSAASTVVGVIGTISSANAQAQAARERAKQERNNAVIAGRNAQDARDRGVIAQQENQLRTRAQLGQQLNLLGERNIELSGTSLNLLADTAMFGELDTRTIETNFEREAISAETQAYNFSAQAALSDLEAKQAKRAGMFAAVGQGLSGVSQFRSMTSGALTA